MAEEEFHSRFCFDAAISEGNLHHIDSEQHGLPDISINV